MSAVVINSVLLPPSDQKNKQKINECSFQYTIFNVHDSVTYFRSWIDEFTETIRITVSEL